MEPQRPQRKILCYCNVKSSNFVKHRRISYLFEFFNLGTLAHFRHSRHFWLRLCRAVPSRVSF
jgi:hypothetical protein